MAGKMKKKKRCSVAGHALSLFLAMTLLPLWIAGGSALQAYGSETEAVTYEIFTGSFADSNGDGIGDLKGIREHLDYINDGDPETDTDLGCGGIWLTPVFPSPTYHKYDARDYMSIDPDFGTMDDFDALISECHKRGIRLYLDLAVNHTSTEHAWFKQAAAYLQEHGPQEGHPWESDTDLSECPFLDYYNFTDHEEDGYSRLEGTDYYYEARFWSGMPDLNLDSDAVRQEISKVTKFWLDKGVDGFRLDAVTSYYTDEKSRSIEFLSWLTKTIKSQDPDAYVVGECWADRATIADYARSGIDSLFDFPFAGQDGLIASAVRSGSGALKWGKAMESAEQAYENADPHFKDAPFYTNHDMARSAGYYLYDDGTKAKLAGGMNLLMTGNAFIYYGEEVGLRGSGKDENKRAPMPWGQKNEDGLYAASCVTAGPPGMDRQDLSYGYVEDQIKDPDSIFTYYRKAVALRNAYPVIAEGKTEVLEMLSDSQVCVFTRSGESGGGEKSGQVLIAVNTGRQKAEIDLAGEPSAASFRTLAASLNAQTEESARAAVEGGSGKRRRGRRKSSAEASSEAQAEASSQSESLVLTSSLSGSRLTLPPYGIAVLTP